MIASEPGLLQRDPRPAPRRFARRASRLALLASVSLLPAALLARPAAAAEPLGPGVTRRAQNRDGVPLRERAVPLGKILARVSYGKPVKVLEVHDLWARCETVPDTPEVAPIAGWCRTHEIAEPRSLALAAAAVPTFATNDLSAAGRQLTAKEAGKQFDVKTEATYRTMDAALNAAYPLVDRVEAEKPTEAEVVAFIREGRLGGTGEAATPAGAGAYAKLALLGATGNTDGVLLTQGEVTELPEAVSDAEFVRQLGLGFSPEHEYWLGRSVAAAAIAEHGLDPDAARQTLVRKVGAAIAMLSDRLPTTHGGWHFAVLDSDVPNGIAGPGGFVLVTRGALALARNEDEVAAVLAHEMAHVAYKHGEQMVRKTREFKAAMTELERRVTTIPRPGEDCNICADVAKTLGTAARALAKTLDVEGYGRDLELQADWVGSLYLCEVGYRASAVAEYLELLPTREGARWTTHPASEDRIDALRPLVFKHGCPIDADEGVQARLPRFRAVMARR